MGIHFLTCIHWIIRNLLIIKLSHFVKNACLFNLSGPAPVGYALEDRHLMHAFGPRTNMELPCTYNAT